MQLVINIVLISFLTLCSFSNLFAQQGETVFVLKEYASTSKAEIEQSGASFFPKGCYGYFHPTYETRVYRNNSQHPAGNGYSPCDKCRPSTASPFVYWSAQGDPDGELRFHKTDMCDRLKFDVVSMKRSEAEAMGFSPFADCYEEELEDLVVPE
jgi:hypothetical protein